MRARRILWTLAASLILIAAQSPDRSALPGPVAAAFESVVSVRAQDTVTVPVFRTGRFRMETVEGLGSGSGVAVAPAVVITNAHVVAGSPDIRVGVPGRPGEARASVIGLDEASDLAALRVEGGGLRPLEFSDGGLPDPGAEAFVIGHRGGSGPEVAWATAGPRPRLRAGARPIEFWSEVSAPIGPGNSGGAVLDAQGRLIGIPSLLITYAPSAAQPRSGSSGLFIPVAHVARSLKRMISGPGVVWPWIGLLLEDSLLAASEGRPWDPRLDLVVRTVLPGSPGATAGFQAGDRVVAIHGRVVRNHFDALDAVLDHGIGETIAVHAVREGAPIALEVEIGVRPADPRPEPVDDFALHTGLRLVPADGAGHRSTTLTLAGLSPRARREMAAFEADMFEDHPSLASILPGFDALSGLTRRSTIGSSVDLEAAISRCFVRDQFVALVHWEFPGRQTIDRAHVHRKIHPVVL
jgi:S1-C subfamily serine protease